YSTAHDLAEDLRHWLAAGEAPPAIRVHVVAPAHADAASASEPTSLSRADPGRGPAPVVPKGPRAYDAADAEFFLELPARPPARPPRPARQPALLEAAHRGDRPGPDLQRRAAVRAQRLRQVVAGQGRVVAPAGGPCPACLHRGHAGRNRGPAAEGPAQPASGG